METYGLPAKHNVRQFEKDLRRKAALTNHLIFNLRCKSELLTPKSLQIRSPIKTSSGTKIAEKASRLFLLERIRVTHHQKRRVLEKLEKVENELKTTLSPGDFQKISQITNRAAEGTFSRSRERQLKKLEHLRLEQKREVTLKPEYLVNRTRWLVNLSNTILDKDEEEVLKLGPKFAPAPKRIPYTDIAAGVFFFVFFLFIIVSVQGKHEYSGHISSNILLT